MDRLPRATISGLHAEREAHRVEKLSANPSKAEVAAIWERPTYKGPSAHRNWVPFHIRVSTTGATDITPTSGAV